MAEALFQKVGETRKLRLDSHIQTSLPQRSKLADIPFPSINSVLTKVLTAVLVCLATQLNGQPASSTAKMSFAAALGIPLRKNALRLIAACYKILLRELQPLASALLPNASNKFFCGLTSSTNSASFHMEWRSFGQKKKRVVKRCACKLVYEIAQQRSLSHLATFSRNSSCFGSSPFFTSSWNFSLSLSKKSS